MDFTTIAAQALARKSSRRQFFKLLTAGSLGTGLFLTRTGVSLGAVTSCGGCGGGPCNPCGAPARSCNNIGGNYPGEPCSRGGGWPGGGLSSRGGCGGR